MENRPTSEDFVSEIPWRDERPDCVVICCSDHRFERQIRDLLLHLNFQRPHVLQVPSGAALSLPLVSTFNFVSKALDRIIDRVVELQGVRDVILVGHHDCLAYRAERLPLIAAAVKRLSGKSIHDLQREHLAQAARRIHLAIRGARVRAFFADVVDAEGGPRVRFDEIQH